MIEPEIRLVLVEKQNQGILIKKQNDEYFWAMATGQGYEVSDSNWEAIYEDSYDYNWYPKPRNFNPVVDDISVLVNVQWEKISRDLYDNLRTESIKQESSGRHIEFPYSCVNNSFLYVERREADNPPWGKK